MRTPHRNRLLNLLDSDDDLATLQLDDHVNQSRFTYNEVGNLLIWLKKAIVATRAPLAAAFVRMNQQNPTAIGIVKSRCLSALGWGCNF